jgi:hypothetical protein
MSPSRRTHRNRIRQRTLALRRAISAMDYVASGTLHSRTKTCGRPNCRCADDPNARHGPYHEWSRRSGGRLVHRVITAQQAKSIARAIQNHRELQKLVARWEEETAFEVLDAESDRKR